MLWFNHSWNIVCYIKETVLQRQGSESKKIRSIQKRYWITKEEGNEIHVILVNLEAVSRRKASLGCLLGDRCGQNPSPSHTHELREPTTAVLATQTSASHLAVHVNKFVQLPQLNPTTIPVPNSSHGHTYTDRTPQTPTKAPKDHISQEEPSPAACPYAAGAPKAPAGLTAVPQVGPQQWELSASWTT